MEKDILNDTIDSLIKVTSSFPFRYIPRYNTLIYHYTSPSGLLGILDDKGITLHFTRYDCVNDKSEGTDVLNCYYDACLELLNSQEIDQTFFSLINNLTIPKTINFAYKNTEGVFLKRDSYNAFICCFSLEKDSLPMWNYYVKNNKYQGYNIGFDYNIFNHYLKNDNAYIFDFIEVVYNKKDKVEKIKEVLKVFYKTFNTTNLLDKHGLISFIEDFLFQAHLVFKSEYFAHEKEIRGIFYLPCNLANQEDTTFKIYYKDSNGYVIPYIEIIQIKKGYLDEITVGPLSEKELSQSTIYNLLEHRGYIYDVKINSSQVPIRF